MTGPQDKREWLVSKGLAKPGRGKFSNAAKEALAEAERNGITFVDKSVTVTTVKTVDRDGNITEVKREVNHWGHHPDPIREGSLTFKGAGKFKLQVNVSEACNSCRFSFGWCYCDVPVFRYWRTGELLSLTTN